MHQHINASWIQRTSGANWQEISLNDHTLIIDSDALALATISQPPAIESGTLHCSLVIDFNDGQQRILKKLSKADAVSLYEAIEASRLQAIAPKITEAAQMIRFQLKRPRYLNDSSAKAIITEAQDWVKRFGGTAKNLALPAEQQKPFDFLVRIANWNESQVAGMQQHYVDEQAKIYQALFDQIETHPLTDMQRRACITAETNNLIIAGAGSGKTSVMVGRAAYLLNSQQATGKEILMLAFANKAAEEMQLRLQEKLGESGYNISVQTFHALGRFIIAQVEGQQPPITLMAEDLKLRRDWVRQCFNHLIIEHDEYQRRLLGYCQQYLYPAADPFSFDREGDYLNFLSDNEIVSLKGEVMHSAQECLIANYLFSLGIEYRYRAPYPRAKQQLSAPRYKTSFFLLESQTYLEYWPEDHHGALPQWHSNDKYLQEREFKASFHQQEQTRLIECSYQQWRNGSLYTQIASQLDQLGVEHEPLPAKAILDTLREFGALNRISELLDQMLGRAKAGNFDASKLDALAIQSSNPCYMRAAIQLLMPIVEHYNDNLADAGQIDFDDMINRAIHYVENGHFRSPWRHIMVDEFQDISEPRAHLVKALQAQHAEGSLCCVGDDWQSIYRFTGSDLSFTTGFADYFGETAITRLDKTFRFNNQISELASKFVSRNPGQLDKQLSTFHQQHEPAVSLLTTSGVSDKERLNAIRQTLDAIVQQTDSPVTVYLLARYLFSLPNVDQLKTLQNSYPNVQLEALSIHASKGKEADYVIVLEMNGGKFGFPSMKETHPLLEAMLPKVEAFPHAEERRLFYVAVTRARLRCYLLADMSRPSTFIKELLENDYPLDTQEFGADANSLKPQLVACPKCDKGTLQPRKGKWGVFYGCSNYPHCNHSEQGCPECDSAMETGESDRHCINEECGFRSPLCPFCESEMKLRKGSSGPFWGCSQFKGKDKNSCSGSLPYQD